VNTKLFLLLLTGLVFVTADAASIRGFSECLFKHILSPVLFRAPDDAVSSTVKCPDVNLRSTNDDDRS